jgi:branched-chain amino acid transport system substrate-binding protein
MSVRGRSARYGTLTLLLAALLVLAACSSGSSSSSGGSSSSPAANSPIAIGYEVPLTGTAAVAGKQEQQGWNLGLKVFGSTVDGHHIVTYFEDTGGDPTVALSDARSLVQQKHVQLMMGPLLASEDAAVAPYLGALRIPTDNLAICGATQLTFDAKYGNALSSGWMCDQPDIIAADYLYNTLGYRHVTVLANDYAFGWLSAGGFIKQFTMLGGKIDKVLWPPLTAADYSPYVSAIPKNTQAVYAETVGSGSIAFTKAYAQFGLRSKIPLYAVTNVFDYSVLPGEVPADVMGDEMAAQYCDGINTPANNKFVSLFNQTYHTDPGYYAEAAYVHAELAVAALKSLHGNATNPEAVARALKTTAITAPRGPVRLSTVVDAPIQNIYICKVEKVNGTLKDVPIKTYANVQPWGTLPYKTWLAEYTKDSTGRAAP